jgi:hypothetical protein
MSSVDTRQINRDSLFLMANIRIEGLDGEYRVKVRNLSAGGMMAEGDVRVQRGSVVRVDLRNIGEVEGSVAWVQDKRFGIAFVREIDPKLARAPQSGDTKPADLMRPVVTTPPPPGDRQRLRKI